MLFTSLFKISDFNTFFRKDHTISTAGISTQRIVKSVLQGKDMWVNDMRNTEMKHISSLSAFYRSLMANCEPLRDEYLMQFSPKYFHY